MSAPLQFDVIRINHNSRKICRCKNPHYEVDPENRMVQCTDCGAYLDAFDVLVDVCKRNEEFELVERKMRERWEHLRKELEPLEKCATRRRVFKEIESAYVRGMLPRCPVCGENFDPCEIAGYTNKRIVEMYRAQKSAGDNAQN